jgi:putative endonuclease
MLNLIQHPSTSNLASMRLGYVYMLTNKPHGTLYIGVTSDLESRLWQHRNGLGSSFVRKYKCYHLVYVEETPRIEDAIAREKQLKQWRRAWKIDLINASNPQWNDLSGWQMDAESSSA